MIKLIKYLRIRNVEALKEEMKLRKIEPNTSEAVELIEKYNNRSNVIEWIEDFKN